MKQFVLFCLLSVPMTISAQTQYFLLTGQQFDGREGKTSH